jgi:PAS domain S-box-containing protein
MLLQETGRLLYDLDLATGDGRLSEAVLPIDGITRHSPDEFNGDGDFRSGRIHPDDRRQTLAIFERAKADCAHYDVEYRLLQEDGTYRYMEDNGLFLKDGHGTACRMLGTLKDIDTRKREEEGLRKNEARHKALIEGIRRIRDGVFMFNGEGCFLFANNETARRFGHDPDWLIGKSGFEVAPPEVRETLKEVFDAVARGETTSIYRYAITSSGDSLWAEVTSTTLLDGENIIGSLGISRDITNRKRTEEALQESERKFRDLADKSPVGIYLLEDRAFKYVNQSMAEMYGYAVDELMENKTVKELVFPEDWPQFVEHSIKELAGEPVSRELGFRGITKSGQTIYLESYSCGTNYKGRSAIIGTVLDVTERKKTEEELKRYRGQLEELVEERTLQLAQLNAALQQDVANRKEVEKALGIKSRNLEEVNTALKVLLKQRDEDRVELEERVSSNVKQLVVRYVQMLRETRLDENQHSFLDIIERNLNDIISPFSKGIASFNLTPKEMEIASLIKEGKTTKQVARLLNVCMDAVSRHRYHIRKKLSLNKQKTNLRSYLLSFH